MERKWQSVERVLIGTQECYLYEQEGPCCLLVQPSARHELSSREEEASLLAGRMAVPVAWLVVELKDWTEELMPWADAAVSRNETIGAGADRTYRFVVEQAVPWLRHRYGELPVVLGGYSLGALFALWAARRCDSFVGVAAASPSLWIAGWPEFAEQQTVRAECVYLSLGDAEEHCRNKAMARVGERVRDEYARLQRQPNLRACTLQWNRGGHFADNARRLADAFAWCVERLSERRSACRTVRQAQRAEVDCIMAVLDAARQTMRASGNCCQWVNGYPSEALIVDDIERGVGYVVEEQGSGVVAYFALVEGPEPSYAAIEGAWIDAERGYHVVHRVGALPGHSGMLATVLDYCFGRDTNIRIDTHRDNSIMRHLLSKNGFHYCGTVRLADGSERLAYQKVADATMPATQPKE